MAAAVLGELYVYAQYMLRPLGMSLAMILPVLQLFLSAWLIATACQELSHPASQLCSFFLSEFAGPRILSV